MRKLFEWLKSPHGWQLFLIYLIAACLIGMAVFCALFVTPGNRFLIYFTYFSYLAGVAALGYVIYTLVLFTRSGMAALAGKSRLLRRIVKDYPFRTVILACGSILMTACYTAFNALIAALEISVWYGTLAVYYGTLVLLRGTVLIRKSISRRRRLPQWLSERRDAESYRLCGVFLILLALVFAVALIQVVEEDRLFSYSHISVYVAAIYTGIKIMFAIGNLFKAKRQENLSVQAIRSINFADALVSVLSLQVAALYFLDIGDAALDAKLMNSIAGNAVYLAILYMGISMILRGNKLLKKSARGTASGDPKTEDAEEALPDSGEK